MTIATLYRMVTQDHVCPFGLKAKWLLERCGYEVIDRHLTARARTDAFKAEYGVETTPQIFIDDVRIGGHDDLRAHLGLSVPDPKAKTYVPVIAIFATTALRRQRCTGGRRAGCGGGRYCSSR